MMRTGVGRRLAIIGSAGVPHAYGGFESFVDACLPELLKVSSEVVITCDSRLYPDRVPRYNGALRLFPPFSANGAQSIMHDLLAFLMVVPKADVILVLGVSGGVWFPFIRLVCQLLGTRCVVNVDGVEWRRGKHGTTARALLRVSDALAQLCAHDVIIDNEGLRSYLLSSVQGRAKVIAYPGDHAVSDKLEAVEDGYCLTVCRIEPENAIDMLIDGFLASPLPKYIIVGNWSASSYGRSLRSRFLSEPRLELRDPVYSAQQLEGIRRKASVYLHGHSVGGTNPSLVEMLFFNCAILCSDNAFNRATAGDCAEYFSSTEELAALLGRERVVALGDRTTRRFRYTRAAIVAEYEMVLWPSETRTYL